MEQNFNQDSQSNIPQKSDKIPILAIVVLSIVAIGFILESVAYFFNNSKVSKVPSVPTSIDSQIIPTSTSQSTTDDVAVVKLNSETLPISTSKSIAEPPVIITNNSYTYGNKVLFYEKNPELEYSDQYVTVYFSDGNTKTEIIHKVSKNLSSTEMPEFKRTSKPNIALLTSRSADMGAFFEEYYYIDLLTKKVLKVYNTFGPMLQITDADHQVSKIELSILDTCGMDENRRQDMDATLEDITVNGTLQHAITQTRLLRCVNPGGIGSVYAPSPEIKFSGVSSDLSKVFFSLEGESWIKEQRTVLWKNNFSFDVVRKVIREEDPTNVL